MFSESTREMTLPALRDDALSSTPDGFAVRLGLPWIRSLPLASVDSIEAAIDGQVVDAIGVRIGDRSVQPAALAQERGWWFLQDRMVLHGSRTLHPGMHDVTISFRLVIPYLQVGPDGPLVLPFRFDRALELDAPETVSVSRDVA